jgi:hypothetical protein
VIQLATRFAAAAALLAGAALALRVGVLHGARGADPCAAPGAMKATSLIPGSVALGEKLEELDADTIQWSEGDVANPVFPALPMRFQIVRSYHATRLYVNPLEFAALDALGLARSRSSEAPLQPEELRVRTVAGAGDRALPIHVAWDHTEAPRGPSRLVAWFFAFDNQPVRSPLAAQLASAPSLAIGGPRPLTLVSLSALATEESAPRVEDAAAAWLTDAWRYVASACTPR